MNVGARRAVRLHSWALVLMMAGCSQSSPEKTGASPGASATPQVELEGARLTETVEGEKVWELDAKRVAYRNPEKVAELEDVSTRFYEDGKVVSEGRAPRAILNTGDRHLRLLGGIHIRTPDNASGFEADEVRWVPEPGQLQAEGNVRFWRPGSDLAAATLKADRAIRRVELGGGVHGKALLGPGTESPLNPSNLLTPSKGPS